jgi:hypothetical protein
MVTYGLIAIGLGAAFATLGSLGLTGRLVRRPLNDTVNNFYGQILGGAGLVGMGLVVLLQHVNSIAALLAVPSLALVFLAMWTAFTGPPGWLRRRLPERGRTRNGEDR